MFRRQNLWAQPLVPISNNQQVIIAAVSSSTFFLVAPFLAGTLGTYLGCTSTACALGCSGVTGALSRC